MVGGDTESVDVALHGGADAAGAGGRADAGGASRDGADAADAFDDGADARGGADAGGADGAASVSPALARVGHDLPPVTGPQQYQVQFSTSEEHVKLIERAKSLLMDEAPSKSLGELHLQAMKLLVAWLEKRKFAITERPRGTTGRPQHREEPLQEQGLPRRVELPAAAPRPRSRHVPAEVRRVVFERDDGRCSFVDERGERCRETRWLELHHRRPFGKHGDHAAANVTLHCRAHNALAAELDFGRAHMAEHRNSHRHESLRSEHRRRARE